MIPKIRIPFAAKVFLSYFAVVLAGALPALLYLQLSFYDQIVQDSSEDIARRGSLIVEHIRTLPSEERLQFVRTQARLEPTRITYLGKTGVVLFDSLGNITALENHSHRPEVLEALGQTDTPPTTPGIGVAHRLSKTTSEENVYVALRVDEGSRSEVLRFAYPMGRIEEITDGLRAAIRNSQASALTVAILLSLLAAYVFGRPLQGLVRSANSLAGGDLTPTEVWTSEDEVGDVGRALNRLALDLRTQLAHSDSGTNLLEQLVEDIYAPVAVLSATDAIAVNAAFRRAVEHDTRDAEEVLAAILRAPAFLKARAQAESQTDGIWFDFAQERFGVAMRIFALKQADQHSLSVLQCHIPEGFLTHWHPNANSVAVLDVLGAVADSIRRCEAIYPEIIITVEAGEGPYKAADVDRRLETALDFAIDAAAEEDLEGFTIEVRQTDTTVVIVLCLALSGWIGKLAGSIVSPLGGVVADDGHSLTFTVPRA